jgi:hypothetical protein
VDVRSHYADLIYTTKCLTWSGAATAERFHLREQELWLTAKKKKGMPPMYVPAPLEQT